ncbi:protein FAR1-RELATED SEQUENCE 3-like isoform X1 [Mangifera indica]|uniref:protein FAR1-RELATED SEQUENCE 3-like isoform X1 n=1 Tax=Mangifera indica TaxID=29780 RepID=UPI001CF9B6F4|nr:protein FAR1-RELATED SEQUENCE 3-like isoform X1 [Mangifera indica]XP_044482351.1 protein FAR1-RELATED SEQUENCE 3-like isoform X1 [Mangifera indica]XP_044482352.1 protein FAR1-RELATED SEQUENCE 3-like isoform X1 [Mangifera indica]XP_044482353.1 protein FAR1-RELATED SEQUENCE 3-like isoform X1 [Mangifera indica]
MDVEVIEVEGEMGHRGVSDDGDAEPNEVGDANTTENSSTHGDDDGIMEPYVGMEFDTEDAAKTFYSEYARRLGFSFKVGQHSRSRSDGSSVAREFVCGREGLKRRHADSCEAMLRIELKGEDKWVVTKFIKEHTHSMVSPGKVHYLRPRRHFAAAGKAAPEVYQGVGMVPSGVMYVSMDGNRVTVETNNHGSRATPAIESNRSFKNMGVMNYAVRPANRKRTLGRDAQNLLDYFKKMQAENPGFFYAIQLDDDNRMTNAFWADSRSRTAYSHFGDAVTLDTMYRVYQYKVPFAPFTGVNHHGQPILFGCALLLDDSEASFAWLFKTFLTAMNDQQPVSITTDQDKAIQAAVFQVFPGARHCISKWHILREGQEKLAHVCHAYPTLQAELYNCINMTETIEEFELSWNSILDKYDLRRHDWLNSIYSARAQWVPVYFRDSFFAAVSPNPGYDVSFFDGYVNQQMTIPVFFRQYERALENSFEREIEADFDTICTTAVLRTPSPMEKQAADFYTRKIFAKFQEELVETFVYTANRIEGDGTISTFRVAKFEDDNKAYIVTLNYPEMRANCSCQMFEYSGILCRHVLTVFTVTNVLTLPPHYILRRWTRNAKTGAGIDERSSELHCQESLTMRYNNLCREAIKYVEDGAIAVETYNVAMGFLREGGKKIAAVKKSVAKVAPPSSQVSGTGYEDRKAATSASDATPLLWPRQDEMTKRFNLNDSGPPIQPASDLNLPRMAPVSLYRDDVPSDNMVVLPCLKSMTWVMENKNSPPGNRIAVINLKLQDYSKAPSTELEVKFQLSRVTLEPMLRSMAYISEQLSTPANRVAVINLKLQDTETTSGESEVKFQVSRDTLGAMLRSMAYIREQLSNVAEPHSEPLQKKQRK